MRLSSKHALLSPELLGSITRLYGAPVVATLPRTSLRDDQTVRFTQLHAQLQEADVVAFQQMGPGDLAGFFRLRLVQVLGGRAPLPALSVVVLATDRPGASLAGGFAERFRLAWPFARCVFLTEGDDHEALSERLGLPVRPIDDPGLTPEILFSDAAAGQKIAFHVQPIRSRHGSTILFENQLEDLVRAGFLTIRVFADGQKRRGPTLWSLLDGTVRENSVHAGGHIDVIAVPDGPPVRIEVEDPNQTWRNCLTAMTACRIHDEAVMEAAGGAECVIVNNLECLGPAIALAPHARMMLASHEDRAVEIQQSLTERGKGEEAAMQAEAATAHVQARILGLVDLCTFASASDLADLAPWCRRAVAVRPRIQVTAPETVTPRFDLLLVGSERVMNIASLHWFLDEVWGPHLEAHSISVAIAGRAGEAVQSAYPASPLLHFLGFVEELEAIRSWCRLTVVPDIGGSGLSIKLLTTLAVGHALATTTVGLRGLPQGLAEALPAHNSSEALAADILGLLESPARLKERQRLVRQVREAAGQITDHADLVMSAPRPTASGVDRRLGRWSQLVDVPAAADAVSYRFTLDQAFPMSGDPADAAVLMDGWHEPEPWGRWTDGAVALLRITLAEPTDEPLTLELDIVPSAVAASLCIGWDGTMLEVIDPVQGTNGWDIPPELSRDRDSFLVSLQADEAICPARLGDSPDDRILGIGVSAIRLRSRPPLLCQMNTFVPVGSGAAPTRVLLSGWHMLEDWGCWSSKTAAALRLNLDVPLRTPLRLELTVTLPAPDVVLTLSINDVALPATTLISGVNHWDLPTAATDGQTQLDVLLVVPGLFCPLRAGVSEDDRELGIGLRGLKLVPLVPKFLEPGNTLRLAMSAALDEVLCEGWHPAEEWGCWSSQRQAELILRFREPLRGPYRLEMDLALPPVRAGLTLSVNGQALEEMMPVSGSNSWSLPEDLTNGQQTLLIGLQVSRMFCPTDHGGSSDSRSLGVGVRWIALRPAGAPLCPINEVIRVSSDPGRNGMLLAGWHPPEPWGCWSSGPDASIALRFDAPLQGAYRLEVEMVPPLLDLSVTLSVDDTVLDTVFVSNEPSEWDLPHDCTDGRSEIVVRLAVPRPARPVDVMDSRDDRVLGVGIRSFRLHALDVAGPVR